jgi:glycosyltransferase involved in cell wall biosynthesis
MKKKIALIGNMNNNNFAMMRYFRDLGADAHLLLYSNDGTGALSHFRPEDDTSTMEQWLPFIHQTKIPNSSVSALAFPQSAVYSLYSQLKKMFALQDESVCFVSDDYIKQCVSEYDLILCTGIAPAFLHRANRKVDVYYPYSVGVEFLDSPDFARVALRGWGGRRLVAKSVRAAQAAGIAASRYVLNAELGLTLKALKGIGVKPINMPIPMVYNRESAPSEPPNSTLATALKRINQSNFSVLSHSRIMWQKPDSYTNEEWLAYNKNTNWLVHSFSQLHKERPSLRATLLFLEYGPDVEATKELCCKLQIEKQVIWLPKMGRKEIMWLLQHVHVSSGEFCEIPNTIWGGTGWEALASGRPLLQGFKFDEGEFEHAFGYASPPMLPVQNPTDLLSNMLRIADNPEQGRKMGREAKEWFDQYNGIGLAKKWLDLLETPSTSENCIGLESCRV